MEENTPKKCLAAKLAEMREKSKRDMRELAELCDRELAACSDEAAMMDYSLAKVVREGSAADIAKAIAHYVDFAFVRCMVASAAE